MGSFVKESGILQGMCKCGMVVEAKDHHPVRRSFRFLG